MTEKPKIRVGMIGYAFMGRAHSHGLRNVHHIFDLPVTPEMSIICGRDSSAVEAARAQLGWQESVSDWREVVASDEIDLVDICTPGSSHAEIAVAALEAGKHVICEKPLANTVGEAEAMLHAASEAAEDGVKSMVAFNYRRVPALAHARRLIREEALGRIFHVRAAYRQDWLVDPDLPLVWRLKSEEAGSGALGDIGAHIVDATQYLLDDRISSVSAESETFIRERPLPDDPGKRGNVTVDDTAIFAARFEGGAMGSFEATRFANGRRNEMTIEINGAKASLRFNLERLNELEFFFSEDATTEQGFRRILMTDAEHPWIDAWWPPGHIIGWEHTFTHQFRDFLLTLGTEESPRPGFGEGLQVQRVLDAVLKSAANGARVSVEL